MAQLTNELGDIALEKFYTFMDGLLLKVKNDNNDQRKVVIWTMELPEKTDDLLDKLKHDHGDAIDPQTHRPVRVNGKPRLAGYLNTTDDYDRFESTQRLLRMIFCPRSSTVCSAIRVQIPNWDEGQRELDLNWTLTGRLIVTEVNQVNQVNQRSIGIVARVALGSGAVPDYAPFTMETIHVGGFAQPRIIFINSSAQQVDRYTRHALSLEIDNQVPLLLPMGRLYLPTPLDRNIDIYMEPYDMSAHASFTFQQAVQRCDNETIGVNVMTLLAIDTLFGLYRQYAVVAANIHPLFDLRLYSLTTAGRLTNARMWDVNALGLLPGFGPELGRLFLSVSSNSDLFQYMRVVVIGLTGNHIVRWPRHNDGMALLTNDVWRSYRNDDIVDSGGIIHFIDSMQDTIKRIATEWPHAVFPSRIVEVLSATRTVMIRNASRVRLDTVGNVLADTWNSYVSELVPFSPAAIITTHVYEAAPAAQNASSR